MSHIYYRLSSWALGLRMATKDVIYFWPLRLCGAVVSHTALETFVLDLKLISS